MVQLVGDSLLPVGVLNHVSVKFKLFQMIKNWSTCELA